MAAAAINSENTVKKIYQTVIEEVLTNVREAFLDEGYDEQLLQELKHLWESKLNVSRAVQTGEDLAPVSNLVDNSSTMRLPVTQSASNKEQTNTTNKTAQKTNSNNVNSANNGASNGNSDVDIKSNIHYDASTRAAIQALPTALYQSSSGQQDKLKKMAGQLDGGVDGGSSDEDDDDDDIENAIGNGDDEEDDVDDKLNNDDPSEGEGKEDPDPLNSDDDLTEPGSPDSNSDLFDTDNVIVCQYDKITRIKNRWKFHLKDGIMNINGKDYLFSKANGDAEW